MTATLSRPTDLGPGRVTQVGVLRSEWIKLRSLRSTWFSLLAAFVIIDGLGTLFSALRAHDINQHGGAGFDFDATEVSLRGVFLAQLAIGVLGVLVISGEYSTGMIRSSLAAVPRRTPVLVAKAAVFAGVVLGFSLVASFGAFMIGQQVQASTHLQASLSTPGAWRAIVGAALYLTLIGLMAVGLGFLIRVTAGAIAALFGIVLVAPILAEALPAPYGTDVDKYLPLTAGMRVVATVNPDSNTLGPWAGIGVTALYAAVALAAGLVALRRRDG
ncbi:ABC transporter permease [Jatrophihabitans sp.]|uniref:ABC transporter permease n=1 Tax=Jatrophihabitans sp. TaxID=1932789 RepID=UPI0030C76198|nr:putative transporter transrane protein [Jatrophihabitans sp.]